MAYILYVLYVELCPKCIDIYLIFISLYISKDPMNGNLSSLSWDDYIPFIKKILKDGENFEGIVNYFSQKNNLEIKGQAYKGLERITYDQQMEEIKKILLKKKLKNKR